MIDLLATTVPLSFAAAISPLVLMGVLSLLGREHGVVRAVAYTVGVVAMTVVIIAVGLVLVERAKGRAGDNPLNSETAQLITAALLIGFAGLLVRPHRAKDDATAAKHHRKLIKEDASPLMFLVFGVVLMCVNVSTIVVLLAILRNVARADQPLADEIVAMAIVGAITTAPAWAPLVLVVAGGKSVAARVGQLGQWTNRNGKYVLAALFFVFGVQDLIKAFG